eukprot:CAMPEP_0172519670 /NCGR_PEP_ID=MMETSP1066-20121228/291555_1 /TAXON_ID=671091 /ORGANISM="Coscinodiscus wailesii, Strain CCMP2513" /LENGTH=363 /DNA_ID=CAMNT_0013302303 /DNA_START=432 /DNA_END=1520 /DNA_ORIENTATION=-
MKARLLSALLATTTHSSLANSRLRARDRTSSNDAISFGNEKEIFRKLEAKYRVKSTTAERRGLLETKYKYEIAEGDWFENFDWHIKCLATYIYNKKTSSEEDDDSVDNSDSGSDEDGDGNTDSSEDQSVERIYIRGGKVYKEYADTDTEDSQDKESDEDEEDCTTRIRGGKVVTKCKDVIDSGTDVSVEDDDDDDDLELLFVCVQDIQSSDSESEDDDYSYVRIRTEHGVRSLFNGDPSDVLFEDSVMMEEIGDLTPQDAHDSKAKGARMKDRSTLVLRQESQPKNQYGLRTWSQGMELEFKKIFHKKCHHDNDCNIGETCTETYDTFETDDTKRCQPLLGRECNRYDTCWKKRNHDYDCASW